MSIICLLFPMTYCSLAIVYVYYVLTPLCVPVADSSSLRIPSWLKPVSGSPEMSFEESRHSYIFSRKREKGERKSRSVKELQSMSLCERKLEILDLLLSCEQIQPIIIKLVSLHEIDKSHCCCLFGYLKVSSLHCIYMYMYNHACTC